MYNSEDCTFTEEYNDDGKFGKVPKSSGSPFECDLENEHVFRDEQDRGRLQRTEWTMDGGGGDV